MVRRTRDVYAGGMALETQENTYHAPTVYLMYNKLGLKPNIEEQDLKPQIGKPGSSYIIRTKAEPSGNYEGWAWPEAGLEQFMKMAFGAVTTTRNIAGTGLSYTHEFAQNSDAMLTASIIRWADALTAKEPEAYNGCMLKKLTFGFDGPGPITMTAEMVAAGIDLSQSAPTKTYTTAAPFVWGQFATKIDGVANTKVTKASISIDLAIDILFGDDGSFSPTIKTPTDWGISGRLEWPYEDWNEMKNYIGGSTSATGITSVIKDRTLQLTCTGPQIEAPSWKYLLDFKMPCVNFKALDNDKDGEKTEMYGFDWAAKYWSGADGGLGTNKIASASVVSQLTSIT